MDYRLFFNRRADSVARDLVGRSIVRNMGSQQIVGTIVETGAYEGGNETASRSGMKYVPGTIFLMPYRNTELFNLSTGKPKEASCVELREIIIQNKRIVGAGRITDALKAHGLDGVFVGDEIRLIGNPVVKDQVKSKEGKSDNCLGYFYLGR